MGKQALGEPDLSGLQAAVLALSRTLPRRRRKTGTVIAALATVAAIGGGVAGYALWGGGDATPTAPTPSVATPRPGDDSLIAPNKVKSLSLKPEDYGAQLA